MHRPIPQPVPHQAVVRRGFTLVEILVVVIILGIASAVIVPNLGTRNDLNVAAFIFSSPGISGNAMIRLLFSDISAVPSGSRPKSNLLPGA